MTKTKMGWRKCPNAGSHGWLSTDGRWKIRGPIWGKPMYWLYYNPTPGHGGAGRFSETGHYEDSLSFPTASAAKKYVERKVK